MDEVLEYSLGLDGNWFVRLRKPNGDIYNLHPYTIDPEDRDSWEKYGCFAGCSNAVDKDGRILYV